MIYERETESTNDHPRVAELGSERLPLRIEAQPEDVDWEYQQRPAGTDSQVREQPPWASEPLPEAATRIGIWGTFAAGKTTYLAMLYHELPKQTDWHVQADRPAVEFVKTTYMNLIKKGVFPEASAVDPALIQAFSYHLFRPDRQSRYTLRFVDASGEWFRNPGGMKERYPNVYPNPFEYLNQCQGIICLFDPSKVLMAPHTDEDETMFEYFLHTLDLLSSLREAAHGDQPGFVSQRIAFCLSKIDMTGMWDHRQDPEALARRVLGEDVIIQIEQYCEPDNYRFFAVSSIGVLTETDDRELPNITEDNRISNARRLRPYNLHAPVEWLLSRIDS